MRGKPDELDRAREQFDADGRMIDRLHALAVAIDSAVITAGAALVTFGLVAFFSGAPNPPVALWAGAIAVFALHLVNGVLTAIVHWLLRRMDRHVKALEQLTANARTARTASAQAQPSDDDDE